MELRRGITGFRHFRDTPLPVSDVSAFSAHCHAVARFVRGRLIRHPRHPDAVEANFVFAVLEVSDNLVAVLLNRHVPIIGFAAPPREGELDTLQFVDCSELAEVFIRTGEYEVLSRADLEHPVVEEDLCQLAQAEIEQVKYWRPTRVGDLVFNFWD